MYRFTKVVCAPFTCGLALMTVFAANAADTSRATMNSFSRAGATPQDSRMPVIATLPTNAVGNMAVDVDKPQSVSPQPSQECPDGGVRNSTYTVNDCMNEVLSCINNGALSGGLNDLFNEDMRNAIVNGMGLCSVQVEKCMVTVRRDCKPVYRSIADVWVDFNSRKVQPEYYNFVLRRTGLTPNQAENTCWLLDKNTYGPSFAAVSNEGATTSEYNNRVGAYNGQMGNVLIKSNPQGVKVNDGNPGVDGQRGHYARWDATTATCYLRVAAYNKDQQIKNSWLFGALGDDKLAEVWRATGDTFTCNKDLFGFSLLNDTSTAAVVGVGGGTLLGAGVGAIAGHGKRAFDCGNEKHRKMMMEQIRADGSVRILNEKYLKAYPISSGSDSVSRETCYEIMDLYDGYEPIAEEVTLIATTDITCEGYVNLDDCFGNLSAATDCVGKGFVAVDQCVAYLNELKTAELAPSMTQKSQPLSAEESQELKMIFGDPNAKKNSTLASLIVNGEKSNMAGSIATGAAIGAGTGGVATAITAFVERNNISCHVGDGLETVAFGKSHSIGSLKDFYVKWNLRLPDTVSPTSTAVDCKSWKLACAQYTDLEQCKSVALNYKPELNGTITLVRSACTVSGSVCIENAPVAASYGACAE